MTKSEVVGPAGLTLSAENNGVPADDARTVPVETASKISQTPAPLVYDLKAMAFNADEKSVASMFNWAETPQGPFYWGNISTTGRTNESRQIIADMLAQRERENAEAPKVEKLDEVEDQVVMLRKWIAALTAELAKVGGRS